MGEQHRAVYRTVAKSMGIQLLSQPMPPLAQTESRAIGFQLALPSLHDTQQLQTRVISCQAAHNAQNIQAVMQRVQPASQGIAFLAQHSRCLT